jgi:hypothetical protein
MTEIDKFFSDADRIIARSSTPGNSSANKSGAELSRLFLASTRDFGTLGTELANYWTERYSKNLASNEDKKTAVDWLGSALALLFGCFTASMDFPDSDWAEIREIVSAEAENLDMDLLVSIMTIIVERGKA